MTRKYSEFDEQLETQLAKLNQPLPLTHVTDFASLIKILKSGELKSSSKCKVYNDNLVYTFYGRPAYRSLNHTVHQDLPFAPVCLILKHECIDHAFRIMPFDSGYFDEYGPAMHETWTRQDFGLDTEKRHERKLCGLFYNDTKCYMKCQVTGGLGFDAAAMHLNQYYRLITNGLSSKFDERCSTVEIQFRPGLDLPNRIQCLIVPEPGLTSEIQELARKYNADILVYRFRAPFRSNELYVPMYEATEDYFETNGIM